jgi:hypothetical protein
MAQARKARRTAHAARETPATYYDRHGVIGEIVDEPVEFALDEELRSQVLGGKRARRLENVSIKLDPTHVQALRKIATMKAIPYQTLIRQWLAEGIRRELHLSA